jgi:hypothetical protein
MKMTATGVFGVDAAEARAAWGLQLGSGRRGEWDSGTAGRCREAGHPSTRIGKAAETIGGLHEDRG